MYIGTVQPAKDGIFMLKGTWTKRIGTKHNGPKPIGDKTYWRQNISATKRIGNKTYRWRNVSADLKKIINKIQTLLDKFL
jgi:hypothetical protein